MEPDRRPLPAEKVYLVGAGPGDPGLITVRGLECLMRADVVLYDCLVNPALLKLAPAHAELVAVDPPATGDRASGAARSVSRLEQALQKKGIVAYLKGGDPEIFSRSAPELEALRRAGVAFEVVPGITAALATAAYAGIPITHLHHSSAVALVSAKQSSQQPGPKLDFAPLAQFPGTLVFYMALDTVADWVPALLRAGKNPQTPAAVVQRVSWPDQQTVRCTLGELVEVVGQKELKEPSVVVIGEVVGLADESNWFTSRPLFGRRVLLTRPEAQSRAMAARLAELGAEVLFQPAIEIGEPPDWGPVDKAIERIREYDWLVFSSVNGVNYFLKRLWDRQQDVRVLGRSRLAAIGPATATALAEWHLRAELVPQEYRAEELAEELIRRAAERGSVGLASGEAGSESAGGDQAAPRADQDSRASITGDRQSGTHPAGGNISPESGLGMTSTAGASPGQTAHASTQPPAHSADQPPVLQVSASGGKLESGQPPHHSGAQPPSGVCTPLADGAEMLPLAGVSILLLRASRGREVLVERLARAGARVDQVVVYTSADVERADPAVAEALTKGRIDWVTVTSSAIARSLVALLGEDLRRTRLASISPVTSQALRELGFAPAAEAQNYTMDGLLEAILDWERRANRGELEVKNSGRS